MKKLPKLFLIVSAVSFAAGAASLSIAGIPAVWTVAVPLGAIFLGLFLIALMLQNEMARFDEEERARLEWAEQFSPAVRSPGVSRSSGGVHSPAALAVSRH